ncbi:MAG: acyl-CoA dehydratase activase [Anaerolineae bacterium]|nr:acyl-CoA dehydratase activase [Anaerolineae bacterium]
MSAGMQWVGLDIGSLTVKIVVLDKGGALVFTKVVPSGRSGIQAAKALLDEVPTSRRFVVVTGYGRVCMEGADLEVSEITCHARGAAHLYGDVGTVIDIGGQDSKVLRVEPNGRVVQFAMNDRCAAGTGRFLEVMARALDVPMADLDDLAARAVEPVPISSTCAVFAESEVVGHLAAGRRVEDVVAGLLDGIAARVAGLARQVGVRPRVVMTGGVALNSGVVSRLEALLGAPISVPANCQVVGALGAALLGMERGQQNGRS